MPLYTKKPIPIEARQITDTNIDELAKWSKSDVVNRPNGTVSGLMVYTLEGSMTSNIGDYLIKGIRGEFYFCARDIFEESYEIYNENNDPNFVHVHSIIDNPDGSAFLDIEMGSKALQQFAKIGLLKVLTEEANRILNNTEEVDTNVGC